jgi:hypothetical protein
VSRRENTRAFDAGACVSEPEQRERRKKTDGMFIARRLTKFGLSGRTKLLTTGVTRDRSTRGNEEPRNDSKNVSERKVVLSCRVGGKKADREKFRIE